MAQVFEDAVRLTALRVPSLPYLLVRDMVQDAYTRACERRGWGHLRTEAALSILVARSITVTFTQGSTAATSAALFVASDVGRQIRVGTYPIYTIATFTDTSTVTLDRAYANTGGAQTAQILSAYATLPADFARFSLVLDPFTRRPIPFGTSQDVLGIADPDRSITGTPLRALLPATPSPVTATLGQVRYEYHPLPTTARQYPYLYIRQAERFTELTPLPGIFSNRADLLKLGALVECAGWPGTVDQKNPYYALEHQDRLSRQYEFELQKAGLADDNQYPDDYVQVDWARYGGSGIAQDAASLRATDATVADYY